MVEAYGSIVEALSTYVATLPTALAQDLSEKVREYYNCINEDDAEFEQIKNLSLPIAANEKITIEMEDGVKQDALLLLSEGHVKILGLSILLAKAVSEEIPFLIFDDIVNSIDDDHRDGVARLLITHTDFANMQMILTCHGEIFVSMLEGYLSNSNSMSRYMFLPADTLDERGVFIKYQDPSIPLEVARKKFEDIIKSKYLIFGVESTGYKEAKNKLNNIEKDVIRNLNNIGTNARSLDGKERLRILHEYFNQGTMEPFRFSFKELSESGKSVKDYIAPPGFDFRYPSRFKSGSMYGSVHYLDIIAPRFNDELLKKLLDIDDNLTITMHMQTMDPVKAIKMLKGALTNIQKMKIEEQKKAVRSGYDMDILPTDIITYEKDTLELLDDLNTSNQKIVKMTFLITCYGKTKRELENITQRVSGIIQQANCNLRCLQYLQEQGLMASAPIGCNDTGIERVLTTKSTAILVPFCTQELFMPAPAIYYGLNALSNNMIMADRKRLRTPNGVILGTPGSGKSFSAKREILSCFLMTRDDIIICDPEGEYFPLVQALKGQVIRLATDSKDYLNPMDIQLSHKGDKEALKLKSDFLITLCDLIAGGKDGLENDEKGIIDECIRHIYDTYFENPVPENMPILEDLYNALLKYEPKNVEKELAKEAKAKAVRIANSLVLYVSGSQNYFNHRTNVDSQNRIICFDIRDLGKQLKELGMLIVQDAVWNGEYYNPLFYFDVGEGTLYGESPGGGGVPGNAIPPDSYDDATVQALMEEAAKYLGYPYVWGGSSPSTSFDCSGFVCWVFTNSGVHNLPRTTAQGIYDQCTPVSASEAKAGDIIFFTGTYNSAGAVSHVGIYCGNGVMIHCGDPIKYASINTPYWQSHFYSFGRLN